MKYCFIMVGCAVLFGCQANRLIVPEPVRQYSQDDPKTYIHNNRSYAVLHRTIADGTLEVEIAGIAGVMGSSAADKQLCANIGARFLTLNDVCGYSVIPDLIGGSQVYNAKHEFWKQAYRCP